MVKKLWIIIIAGIVLLAGLSAFLFFATDVFDAKNSAFITFKTYDSDGNLITNHKTLSIVAGDTGVEFIDLSVNVKNIGDIPLSCRVSSASPTAFASALSTNLLTLDAGKSGSWTSSQIAVKQFEGATPTTFSATVLCSYNDGHQTYDLPEKTGTLPLLIQFDATGANFEVGIGSVYDSGDSGDTTPNVCGDGTCQSTETTSSCATDCAVSANVRFRTSSVDGTYASGSWIAFDSNNDSVLECYVYSTSSTGTSAKKAVIIKDMYNKEWSLTGADMYLYTGYSVSYGYRKFPLGTGCELSPLALPAYNGREIYF